MSRPDGWRSRASGLPRRWRDRAEDTGVRRVPFLVVVLLAALLVVGDALWRLGDRAPVLTALLTDLLLIAGAAVTVDAVLRHRESKRVDEVERVMYRALAQLAFDGRRRMSGFACGQPLEQLGVPGWTGTTTQTARRLLRVAGEAPARVADDEEVLRRLRVLLHQHEFAAALYLDVSVHKRRVHDVVGDWAPVLLATDATAQDLRQVRDLADALGHLHQVLHAGAATVLPPERWRAVPDWLDHVEAAARDYLALSEAARRSYHALAEEQRRLRVGELDAAQAVTQQPPLYLRQAEVAAAPGASWDDAGPSLTERRAGPNGCAARDSNPEPAD